jgi:hypothetical protein
MEFLFSKSSSFSSFSCDIFKYLLNKSFIFSSFFISLESISKFVFFNSIFGVGVFSQSNSLPDKFVTSLIIFLINSSPFSSFSNFINIFFFIKS